MKEVIIRKVAWEFDAGEWAIHLKRFQSKKAKCTDDSDREVLLAAIESSFGWLTAFDDVVRRILLSAAYDSSSASSVLRVRSIMPYFYIRHTRRAHSHLARGWIRTRRPQVQPLNAKPRAGIRDAVTRKRHQRITKHVLRVRHRGLLDTLRGYVYGYRATGHFNRIEDIEASSSSSGQTL